jgi:hypothetical protein
MKYVLDASVALCWAIPVRSIRRADKHPPVGRLSVYVVSWRTQFCDRTF